MEVKLKVTITGVQTIDADDWLDEFCEEHGIDPEERAVDPEALKAFAIAALITTYEEGDNDPTEDLEDASIEVTEVPAEPATP